MAYNDASKLRPQRTETDGKDAALNINNKLKEAWLEGRDFLQNRRIKVPEKKAFEVSEKCSALFGCKGVVWDCDDAPSNSFVRFAFASKESGQTIYDWIKEQNKPQAGTEEAKLDAPLFTGSYTLDIPTSLKFEAAWRCKQQLGAKGEHWDSDDFSVKDNVPYIRFGFSSKKHLETIHKWVKEQNKPQAEAEAEELDKYTLEVPRHSAGDVTLKCAIEFGARGETWWDRDVFGSPTISFRFSTRAMRDTIELWQLWLGGEEEVPHTELKKEEGMEDVSDLLTERGTTHGGFADNARIAQSFRDLARSTPNWKGGLLTPEQREALDYIVGKISRICSGDPNHPDHWADIIGYARLVLGSSTPQERSN